MKKSIGFGIENLPQKDSNLSEDENCPFFGKISVRGKTFEGTVISDSMNRTVSVSFDRYEKSTKYERYFKKTTKLLAHNSDAIKAKKGDRVLIGETRPISKRKHFVVLKIISNKGDKNE